MISPTVVTDNAVSVAKYSATLVGRCTWVDPTVATSYIMFQWGKTTAYDNNTFWEQAFLDETYSHDISGLEENTTYHFRIIGWTAGALASYGSDRTFTTTIVGPPPVSTPFMGWLISKLNDVSGWFYSIYRTVYDWVWPFWLAADAFYWLSTMFNGIAWDFYYFSVWVDDIANKIVTILSWDTVWSYILTYVPNLEAIRDWFSERWSWFTTEINNWWSETVNIVIGWIDALRDWALFWINYLHGQIYSLNVKVDQVMRQIPDITELMAWFSNWTGNVTSMINTWWTGALSEVQSLINSAFIEREPFWAGWQDWRDKVTEFFTDPEDWLYKSLDRIVERYW